MYSGPAGSNPSLFLRKIRQVKSKALDAKTQAEKGIIFQFCNAEMLPVHNADGAGFQDFICVGKTDTHNARKFLVVNRGQRFR